MEVVSTSNLVSSEIKKKNTTTTDCNFQHDYAIIDQIGSYAHIQT